MNYTEARTYLDEISKCGSVLGLEGMKELLDRLGNPQDDLKFIHISGTNGKGSVLAYLSTARATEPAATSLPRCFPIVSEFKLTRSTLSKMRWPAMSQKLGRRWRT